MILPRMSAIRAIIVGLLPWSAMSCLASSVRLELGDDFAEVCEQHPAGTTFVIATGVHRGQSVLPKEGCVFVGEPGAVLNGSVILSEWEKSGAYWVSREPLPRLQNDADPPGGCWNSRCRHPQDLFRDNQPLIHAETRANGLGEDEWFVDFSEGRIYLSFDPSGHLMEFGGSRQSAFTIDAARPERGRNVIIRNVCVEKYPTSKQQAAIHVGTQSRAETCEARWNHAVGIGASAGAAIVNCHTHHNGQTGLSGHGSDIVITDCQVNDNAWAGYRGDFETGGIKLAGTTHLRVQGCYVHRNQGPGIWLDIDSTDFVVSDNIVENNDWEGVLIEISCSGRVEGNVCRWNGGSKSRLYFWGGQICIQNSRGIDIIGNYVETKADDVHPNGITCINQNGRGEGNCGVHGCANLLVEGNVIVSPTGSVSGINYGTAGWSDYPAFLSAGIAWEGNTYHTSRPDEMVWGWHLRQNFGYMASSLTWEAWRAQFNDGGGELVVRHLESFSERHPLAKSVIEAAVAWDYASKLASFVQRDNEDGDLDGLPNWWEIQYNLPTAVPSAQRDTDGDGLTDFTEFTLGLDPTSIDTDKDGMPDGWEHSLGLNPALHDGFADPDGDGVTNREEFVDGSDPHAAPPEPGIVTVSPSLWLSVLQGVRTGEADAVVEWIESSPWRRRVYPDYPTQPRLLSTGSGPSVSFSPGRAGFVADSGILSSDVSEFVIFLVIRPSPGDIADGRYKGLMVQEDANGGFRIFQGKNIKWSTKQNGGDLDLVGALDPNWEQPVLVSLRYGGSFKRSSLYLNGVEVASVDGKALRCTSAALFVGGIGGTLPCEAGWQHVAVFQGAMSFSDQRAIEHLLRRQYQEGGGISGADSDHDGMPDAWEILHQLNPSMPNALHDDDDDGLPNLTEFARSTDPTAADTDADGMLDGWEVLHGLIPTVDDAGADHDNDGLSNVDEFEDRTDPSVADLKPSRLPFAELLGGWRGGFGVLVSGGVARAWTDVRGRSGVLASDGGLRVVETEGGTLVGSSGILTTQPVLMGDGGFALQFAFSLAGLQGSLVTVAQFRLPDDRQISMRVDGPALICDLRAGGSTVEWARADLLTGVFNVVTITAFRDRLRLDLTGMRRAETGVNPIPGGAAVLSLGSGQGSSDRYVIGDVFLWEHSMSNAVRRLVEESLVARWQAEPEATDDSDGDTVPDAVEILDGTSWVESNVGVDSDLDGVTDLEAYGRGRPLIVHLDEDKDGMNDHWEIAQGLDPAVSSDASEDPDGDGVPNIVEHFLNRAPLLAECKPWLSVRRNALTDAIECELVGSSSAWGAKGTIEWAPFYSNTWMEMAGVLEEAGPGLRRLRISEIGALQGQLRLRVSRR